MDRPRGDAVRLRLDADLPYHHFVGPAAAGAGGHQVVGDVCLHRAGAVRPSGRREHGEDGADRPPRGDICRRAGVAFHNACAAGPLPGCVPRQADDEVAVYVSALGTRSCRTLAVEVVADGVPNAVPGAKLITQCCNLPLFQDRGAFWESCGGRGRERRSKGEKQLHGNV